MEKGYYFLTEEGKDSPSEFFMCLMGQHLSYGFPHKEAWENKNVIKQKGFNWSNYDSFPGDSTWPT